ncbi:MAG: response regulator [Nannocystaceae bacterium]|nr:response regulator [Nannocystaceae bacterium]
MLTLALGALLATAPSIGVHRQTWDTADGLPQSSVTAVVQDPQGFLVLGTFAGLAQFDGRSFTPVDPTTDAGFSGLRVTALAIDSQGDSWVGTQDGRLLHAHGGALSEHSIPAPFSDHSIWSISSEGNDTWLASPRGVGRWNGETWTVLERPRGVNTVLVHEGTAWLGKPSGLERIREGRAEPVVTDVGGVLSLCANDAGIVVGGETGVAWVSAEGVVPLDTQGASQVVCARDGSVWAGWKHALRRVGFEDEFTFPHSVRTVFEDRERNLWVGTDGGGLTRVIRADWTVSETPGGALPILQLPDDSLLVGAFCGTGGLFHLTTDGELSVVSERCVRALALDEQGVLVGMDSHIQRWSHEEGLQDFLEVGHPVLVLEPAAQDLWVGTDTGGAFRVHEGMLEPVHVGDVRVLSILATQEATWFGTHRGLTRLDDSGQTRWTSEDGVPPGPIRGLLEDSDGTLFIASYGGGLGILRDGEFRRLTVANGLGDNAISSVLDDGRGALWINGNRGLTRLRRHDLEAWLAGAQTNPRMRRWDTPEGNGGGQPAGAVLRDGTLAFPTAKGVLHMSPQEVFRNPIQPRVVVESGDVDGVLLVPGETVRVPPGPGRVFVDFTAATLRHPELATLEVRLTDVQASEPSPWEMSADGMARWGRLRPGTYEIELRATNEDDVRSEPISLLFELEPYWHQRVEFWVGFGLLALAGGVAGHGIRIRGIAERNRELQREVAQRISAEEEQRRIARRLAAAERMEAVGRLAGGIAHDFNNLLTAVAGTSTVLRGIHEEREIEAQGAPLLDSLDRCVKRGGTLTRSLLSFARKQPIDPSLTNVDALVHKLTPMLETSLRGDITLRFTPAPSPTGAVVDPAMLELAIINLTLNAQDALASGGEVNVGVERIDSQELERRFPGLVAQARGDWTLITVRDDGEGMSPEQLIRAREPFFTTRDGGNGLGLPSVEGFAAQSGGALHLRSGVGQGTTVSIVLQHFDAPDVVAPIEEEPVRTTGVGRVLLCDDDELVRASLVRVLERAGYETSAFGDPCELLERVGPHSEFDILVTDVLMPGMTGDELARRVEALRPGVPVVFMSGYTDDIRADTLGGRLLHKPFGSAEVVRVVEETLAEYDGSSLAQR